MAIFGAAHHAVRPASLSADGYGPADCLGCLLCRQTGLSLQLLQWLLPALEKPAIAVYMPPM